MKQTKWFKVQRFFEIIKKMQTAFFLTSDESKLLDLVLVIS